MTPTIAVGDRISSTVAFGAAWEGALTLPVGSLGTVTELPIGAVWGYAVVFDADPDQMPLSVDVDEMEPFGAEEN
ncbi:hypothetical protein [Kitasatospora sp. NPDC050543]|uniref:hypothetical protein n=1 Tax=Kitasatospora sp. NPDC050543 TaxID=3364054 RepID=UPI0037ABCAEA